MGNLHTINKDKLEKEIASLAKHIDALMDDESKRDLADAVMLTRLSAQHEALTILWRSLSDDAV